MNAPPRSEPGRRLDPRGPLGATAPRYELLIVGAVLLALTGMVVKLPPLFVVGGVVGVAGAVVFMARPELGLLAYFGFRIVADLLWWVPISVGGLSGLEVLSGGVTALAALLFFLELRKVERHPAFATLAIYLTAMVLAAIRSLDLKSALSILAEYTSPLLIMFLVTALFRTPAAWRRLMGVLAVVGLVPIVESLGYLASGQMSSFAHGGYNRLIGGYAALHTHAHMMALLALLGVFWYSYFTKVAPRGIWRMISVGAIGAALMCLLFTYVRTPLIGLAVFALVFPVLEKRYGELAIVVGLAILVMLASSTVRDRMAELLVAFSDDDPTVDRLRAGSGRLGVWVVSMKTYLHRPIMDLILGVGLGGHWLMVQPYLDKYRTVREGTLNPHNDYLGLLYQLGPFAVFSYVAMQISTIRHALKLRKMTRDPFILTFAHFMVGLMIVSMVTNLLSNSFVERVTPAMILWSCAGLVFAMHRYVREENQKAAKNAPPPPPKEVWVMPPVRLRSASR